MAPSTEKSAELSVQRAQALQAQLPKLACPKDKGPLVVENGESQVWLVNERLGIKYSVSEDGIPQLLPESGVPR